MSERGTFIGYAENGQPVAVANYGPDIDTRETALAFASKDGLEARDFPAGDPDLPGELDKLLPNAGEGEGEDAGDAAA